MNRPPPKSIDLGGASAAERTIFLDRVLGALNRGGFTTRALRRQAVVIVEQGAAPRATSRGDAAHYFHANGLDALAREVIRRKVYTNQVLVYASSDQATGIVVLDIAKAKRELGSAAARVQ